MANSTVMATMMTLTIEMANFSHIENYVSISWKHEVKGFFFLARFTFFFTNFFLIGSKEIYSLVRSQFNFEEEKIFCFNNTDTKSPECST